MTNTNSLLDEIQSIISYESATWPLRCSLSSTQITRINEIVNEIKLQTKPEKLINKVVYTIDVTEILSEDDLTPEEPFKRGSVDGE